MQCLLEFHSHFLLTGVVRNDLGREPQNDETRDRRCPLAYAGIAAVRDHRPLRYRPERVSQIFHSLSSDFEVRVDDPNFALAGDGRRLLAKGINRVLGSELSS